MAMGAAGGGGGGRGRRRRNRKGPLTEINVTPLVDVMLVLLIIFMISAPLLTVGVPLELPKTEAGAVSTTSEPVTVSIKRDGAIYVGEGEVNWEQLIIRVAQDGGEDARDKPVFVRADGQAPYQAVARVMARLSSAGFTKLNLITDTVVPGSADPGAEG
jgi:biopolymer transport protein TolR